MFPLGRIVVLLSVLCSVEAATYRQLILDVQPNPARIHINAPPGTPVLSITGYDAATLQRLEQVQISNTADTKYFILKDPTADDNKWYLYSKISINKPINYVFKLRVYGTHQGTVTDKEIVIKVSKPNLYGPVFDQPKYEFIAYRNSADLNIKLVGTVLAKDDDFEAYNSKFDYFIFDRKVAGLFNVDSSGKVVLVSQQNFPRSVDEYTFQVLAIDAGSPQKRSNTTVHVRISDIPPPDIFCVSVEGVRAKFCWKDPTNGKFVNNYQLQFSVNDRNITTRPVAIHGKRNEICTSVSGQHMERSYRFTVQVFNGTDRSPSSVQRFVNISKSGLYGDCLQFSNCSIWKPCKNGKCLTKQDMSYECECYNGWLGRNCTEKDPCYPSPCLNSGNCLRTPNSSEAFKCSCPSGYSGTHCHLRNHCLNNPCFNNGSCFAEQNGEYHCKCLPHYTGKHCETKDPCAPNPCHNLGLCHNITNVHYVCSCMPGYYGNNCDQINRCELKNPCRSGRCIHVDDNQFQCECFQGSSGKYCNITDGCNDSYCENGGTCVPSAGNSDKKYECQCLDGFFGDQCQHYDPCSKTPCRFDGVCHRLSDQHYQCECKKERFGENCQYVDGCKIHTCGENMACQNISFTGAIECLCNSLPCRNKAKCKLDLSSRPYCECRDGFSGSFCERSCAQEPCLNEGTCELNGGSYECVCPDNFFGPRCQKYAFCNATRMCIKGARCELEDKGYHHLIVINQTMTANVSNWYTCSHCPKGFTGSRCQFKTNPCDHNLCGLGICQKQGNSYICLCSDNTLKKRCYDDSCQEDNYYDRTGRYTWPSTRVGYRAQLRCPHGSTSTREAVRLCRTDQRGFAQWANPDTSSCKQLTLSEADMALLNLVAYTGDSSHLTSQEVANVTNQLEGLAAYAVDDVKVAKDLTMVISNLLEARENVLIESNHNNHSSERLVEMLHEYTTDVPMQTNFNATIETKNINIMVVNHSLTDDAEDFHYKPFLSDNTNFEQGGISMMVPGKVMQQANKENVRLHFIAYRTSAFFIPETETPEEVVMKQRVITAEIKGKKVQNLTNPIVYRVKNIENNRNHTCVYWNDTNWSTEGVYTTSTSGNMTECYTTHLTSFAILMDPVPSYKLDDIHDRAMTYISYIGCAVSIFGLAITIVTYSMFRSLNREKSSRILLNMCVSMLLMNVSFLMMAETTKSEGNGICMAIAILLHYFLLTSLMWMLTEAINMYHALITVFTTYSSQFILKRCIISWGLPAIVVAITMGVNKLDNYNTKTDFCFISHANTVAFYIALLGPACCILIINTVVFTLVARVILKPKFRGHPNGGRREKVTPTQVRGAFTVMVLLGVTWVFGPVAINESKVVFNYLFVVLNSLQGFLIFIFRCLINTEVKLAWLYLMKTGKFKRRRGPIKSTTDSSSSSKALHDSKTHHCVTDSTIDTSSPRTSVANGRGSNGFPQFDKTKDKEFNKFSKM